MASQIYCILSLLFTILLLPVSLCNTFVYRRFCLIQRESILKKVTIVDIAKEAGVSKATVSRVISNPELVKPSTRNKILELIEKYSYIPNQSAKTLAGSPTKNIGIVIDELSNLFFIEIAEGVEYVLAPNHYSMQLSSSLWQQSREELVIKTLISNRVDGILLSPILPSSNSISMLKKSGIPFVLINATSEDEEVAYVSCDNYYGGQLAAEYVNKTRQEQIIMVTGFDHQTLFDRIQGFKDHINPKTTLHHYSEINTFRDGYDLVPILLIRNKIENIKTTLFVTNDNVAIGIINHLLQMGVKIPHQVSVIGYDNIRISEFSQIPLTTVSQSIKEMGRIAAIELLEMIEDKKHQVPKHLITPKLIVRQSSCINDSSPQK